MYLHLTTLVMYPCDAACRCNDVEGFARIPGLGPLKAKRLLDTFNQPFRRSLTAANTAAAGAGAAGAAAGAGAAGGGVVVVVVGGGGGGGTTSGAAATGAGQQQQAAASGIAPGLEVAADSAAEGVAAGGQELQVAENDDLELYDWEADVERDDVMDVGGGVGVGEGAEQEEWDGEGWEGEQGEGLGTEEWPGALGGYHEDYLDGLDDAIDAEDF
jgi:hypothetical protein